MIIMDCKNNSSVLGHLSWPRLQPYHYTHSSLRIVCVLFHVVSDVRTGDMIP